MLPSDGHSLNVKMLADSKNNTEKPNAHVLELKLTSSVYHNLIPISKTNDHAIVFKVDIYT